MLHVINDAYLLRADNEALSAATAACNHLLFVRCSSHSRHHHVPGDGDPSSYKALLSSQDGLPVDSSNLSQGSVPTNVGRAVIRNPADLMIDTNILMTTEHPLADLLDFSIITGFGIMNTSVAEGVGNEKFMADCQAYVDRNFRYSTGSSFGRWSHQLNNDSLHCGSDSAAGHCCRQTVHSLESQEGSSSSNSFSSQHASLPSTHSSPWCISSNASIQSKACPTRHSS